MIKKSKKQGAITMAKINITPEMLNDKSTKLRQHKEEHVTAYNQIKQLVGDITSVWEGDSQKAFQESFNQKDREFVKFADEIEQFAQLMNDAARQMQDTEAQITSQMRR
jgi:WXG100 family type VII secretion target